MNREYNQIAIHHNTLLGSKTFHRNKVKTDPVIDADRTESVFLSYSVRDQK